MEKIEGIHFYINVKNLNDVIFTEEEKTGTVNHSIHAIDTYFSSVEAFGKKHYSDNLVIEKITGSRLHMYVTESIEKSFEIVLEIVGFAWELAKYVNNEIPKYKTLLGFQIQVGACFGRFYNFKFEREDFEEETTIGYAANLAAKLQSITPNGKISISSNIFESIKGEYRKNFEKKVSKKIRKYGEDCYYEAQIDLLPTSIDPLKDLEYSKQYANKLNLSAMEFREASKILNIDNLSKKECKKLYGIPLFADVRGFTAQFDKEDINLKEMADKTQKILTCMYEKVESGNGIHVQFQGDREFAIFHNYTNYNCIIDAVKVGLRLLDAVKEYSVCIGIGEDIGPMFAARIGTRGEKDAIIVGSTVINADTNEDENAGENQLVISNVLYEELKKNKSTWAECFEKGEGYYFITVGYEGLINRIANSKLREDNKKNNYNGAWRL